MTALGTYAQFRTGYKSTLNGDSITEAQLHAIYTADSASCAKLCNTNAPSLQTLQQLMINDMVPYTGQYAQDPSNTATIEASMYHKYNIFSTNGSSLPQPFYQHPFNSLGSPDTVYYTQSGDTDRTVMPIASLAVPAYQQLFNTAWASQLLPYHPEYSKLRFAIDSLSAAYSWMDNFEQVSSYSQGITNVNSSGNITGDPFYSIAPGSYQMAINSQVSGTGYMNGLSMWQVAYGDVFCKTTLDSAQRGSCYSAAPLYPPSGGYGISQANQDQLWGVFSGLYTTARNSQLNSYINLRRPLADTSTLVSQQYILYFPNSNAQAATQYNWTWFPGTTTTPGSVPNAGIIQNTAYQYDTSYCLSYVPLWKQQLLLCSTLNALAQTDSVRQQSILTQITNRMVSVCQGSTSAANPYGATTMPAGTLSNLGDSSFEQIVNAVYKTNTINTDLFCNPYVITSPRPTGMNPRFTRNYISVIDSCSCTNFNNILSAAQTAGYSTGSAASLNTYLMATYNDSITTALYNALIGGCPVNGGQERKVVFNLGGNTQLSGTTPGYIAVLAQPQPQPQFLQCGYVAGSRCITCGQFSQLTRQFDSIFGSPYNNAPRFTGVVDSATTGYNALFARFLNYRTGLQYNWLDYAQAMQNSNCSDTTTSCAAGYAVDSLDVQSRGNNTPGVYLAKRIIVFESGFSTGASDSLTASVDSTQQLCTNPMAITLTAGGTGSQSMVCAGSAVLTDTTGLNLPLISPCSQVNNMAVAIANQLYALQQQQLINTFDSLYRTKCLSVQSAEQFAVTYTSAEYHYTLYYYDQAGNLVKTVPPKGVNPNFSSSYLSSVEAAKQSGTSLTPAHTFTTNYRYNSLNQVIAQLTPDGGLSHYWYDRLGRLAVSQNAKQAIYNQYSYTVYDSIGRITEVGQNTTSTAMSQAISQNDGSLISWIYGGTGDQITQTVYDIPYSPLYGQYISQQNLRNRVSYTVLYNQAADTSYLNRNPASASYYTYDIHGNVDTLLQDYNGIASMKNSNNRFKLIAYNYDLISGKVNEVDYQPGRSDAFYEMYSYDAENRITAVNYSRDKQYWEQEAAYEYYKHGPLARTVLGQLQVQGLKYRYTLQGWLKGVNAAIAGVDATAADSSEVFPVSHDAYGFSLHYYPGDYTAIKSSTPYTGLLPALGSSGAPLFNGNIAAMAVNIKAIGSNAAPLVYNYHYDQLNRLVSMDAYSGLNTTTGSFTPIQLSTYAERAGYDPNGNITSYIRHGDAARVQMDSLTYSYKAGKNQLDNVVDNAADAAPGQYSNYNDLKQGQQAGNYQYDAIGNLTSDAQAGISNIIWTVYGKIDSIYKTDGTGIKYHYDVAGNRISKVVTKGSTVSGTYYVRDAQGNVLSVYQDGNSMALTQMENHLYGSSRLGMVTALTVPNQNIALSGGNTGIVSTFTRGEKLFELSNHLGNVLVTLTDKKLQHTSDNATVDYYVADVASASDYYPFGMQMPGRNITASTTYRYGFNGQENSTEIAANTTTAEYWEYDSRISRRWNVDPVYKNSPYECFANNPIAYADPSGLDSIKFSKSTTIITPKQKGFSGGGQKPSGSTTFGISTVPMPGDDVYTFTNTFTTINGDGESKTTSTTKVLHPEDPTSAVGVTKGLNLYFDGLITTERNNYDWESIGKIMSLDKGFSDYMVSRNSNAKDWQEKAGSMALMEGIMPIAVQSAFSSYLGFRFSGETPNISYLTKEGNYPSWNTVKNRYWELKTGGKVPTGQAIVRIRKSGEIREIIVFKELHHLEGRTGTDPHNYSNLQEVWPWEHEAVDKSRHTGYDFLKWKNLQ